jgi:acyl-coenzyme A thioesterase PaaI-like protein
MGCASLTSSPAAVIDCIPENRLLCSKAGTGAEHSRRALSQPAEGFSMSQLWQLYQSLGNERYADAIAKIAPYFGTIAPRFRELRPRYCALEIPNTQAVHNHLGSMHAIAMCNGAELAAGLTTDVSIPNDRRWIPVEMNVRYLAQAKSDVLVVCAGDGIDWAVLGNIPVNVSITNTEGVEVLHAIITMRISPKK